MSRPDVRVLVVRTANFDARSGAALIPEAMSAFTAGAACLIFDLGAVTYLDSLGISVLVEIHHRAPAGSRLCLAGLQQRVRAIARLTRLYEVFTIYASVADAQRAEAATAEVP
jgi:anti-sigma B factor antagonist